MCVVKVCVGCRNCFPPEMTVSHELWCIDGKGVRTRRIGEIHFVMGCVKDAVKRYGPKVEIFRLSGSRLVKDTPPDRRPTTQEFLRNHGHRSRARPPSPSASV